LSKDQDSSTRKVLLTMMKTKGPLSVNEMAKQLGITEMAVRRHLNTLERDGLIEAKISRQAMGRPTHLYSLTTLADDLFPKNYHTLTLDLLVELECDTDEGKEQISRLFERRKLKLMDKYAPRMEGKDLDEKVAELAEIQNANGYMVDWQKTDTGSYVLNEYNCPITQVANQYDAACKCELALFQKLLGADVERTECISKGGGKCSYHITPADSASPSEDASTEKQNGQPE
jgi:predicted ArsR family transcriptional regulator